MASTPVNLTTVYSLPDATTNATSVAIHVDWNDNNVYEMGISSNINKFEAISDCNNDVLENLKGFDDWSHLHLALTGDPNYSDGISEGKVEENEISIDTIKKIRLGHIEDLDRMIENLPDNVFINSELVSQMKDSLHHRLLVDSDSASNSVGKADFISVIKILQEIRSKTDGSVGGNKLDDFIKESIVQHKILEKIDVLISGFKRMT